MKNMTKWLALLLAGLLMSASLVACGGDEGWTPDGDEDEAQVDKDDKDNDDSGDDDSKDDKDEGSKDDEEEGDGETTKAPATDTPETTPPATDAPVTTPPATDAPETTPPATDAPETTPPVTDAPVVDQPITTEGEYENMAPSELYTALTEADQVAIGTSVEGVYFAIGKSGDIVSIFQGISETDGTLIYADYGEKMLYAQVNGEWNKAPMGDDFYDSWQALLELMQLTPDLHIFIDDNFNAFTDADATLSIKDSVLAGSDFSSITIERDGLRYILSETYSDGETIQTVFSFADTGIELPEAKDFEGEGNEGTAQPDDPAEAGEYEDMTPAALYNALTTANEMYLSLETPEMKVTLEKEGDKVRMVNDVDGENEETFYFDLANDVGYAMIDGEWQEESLGDDYTWGDMLVDLSIEADGRFFNEDNYEPYEEGDYFWYIKADLLNEGENEASFYCSGDYYSLDVEFADYTEASFSVMFTSCYVSFPEVN